MVRYYLLLSIRKLHTCCEQRQVGTTTYSTYLHLLSHSYLEVLSIGSIYNEDQFLLWWGGRPWWGDCVPPSLASRLWRWDGMKSKLGRLLQMFGETFIRSFRQWR